MLSALGVGASDIEFDSMDSSYWHTLVFVAIGCFWSSSHMDHRSLEVYALYFKKTVLLLCGR